MQKLHIIIITSLCSKDLNIYQSIKNEINVGRRIYLYFKSDYKPLQACHSIILEIWVWLDLTSVRIIVPDSIKWDFTTHIHLS